MSENAKTAAIVGLVVIAVAAAAYIVATYDVTGERPQIPPPPPTDPDLLLYSEADTFDTGFDQVHAIAVGPGDLTYVAGSNAVRVFNSDGEPERELAISGARSLAVDADGTLYAATRERIYTVADDGGPTVWKELPAGALVTGITASEDDVLVADHADLVVRRYDRSGELVNEIGAADEGRDIRGLRAPTEALDVAVGPDGLAYVTNPGYMQIEVYTLAGDPLAAWGEPGTDIRGFRPSCNPCQLAVLSDGRLVTSERGEPRVKIYEKDGGFVGVVAGPELFPPPPAVDARTAERPANYVAVDSVDRVLVLDPVQMTVRIFVEKGGER